MIDCRALVVPAPKMFSVMPPPNAAPSPSLFGRCISTSKMMSSDTSTLIARRILMMMDMMRARNMEERACPVKWNFSFVNSPSAGRFDVRGRLKSREGSLPYFLGAL